MKRLTKTALSGIASQFARWPLKPLWNQGRAGDLHVLTYHRVDWPDARDDLCPSTLSATPTDFVAQMQCLQEHFHPVGLDHVRAAFTGDAKLPARSVLITFDDAYRDFAEHAWPVLKRLDLPATMFVPTIFPEEPNRPFWWDRLHQIIAAAPVGAPVNSIFGRIEISCKRDQRRVAKRVSTSFSAMPHAEALDELQRLADALVTANPLPAVLGWDQLKTMSEEGLFIAPHTRSHPLMHRIPLEQARDELRASRDDIRRHIGEETWAFAYPGGAYNQAIVATLAEEGFELGFTTHRGANRIQKCDSLQLRRINVGRRTTPALLSTQLLLPPPLINRIARLRRTWAAS